MVSILVGTGWGLLLAAALGYAGVARKISRHDEFPGQPSVVATANITAVLLVVLTIMGALTRLELPPQVEPLQALMLVFAFAAAMMMPLIWLRFALQYTGQRFPTGRSTFIRLGLPIAFTLVVVAVTLVIGLLMFEFGVITVPESFFEVLEALVTYSVALTAFYLAALLVVGASLIAWTSYSFTHLSNEGGVLIGIGFVLPWFGIAMPEVANLFTNQPLAQLYHSAVGATAGVSAVWLATTRYDLFRHIPAAGTVGRDVTVEEMTEPVLVADEAGRVIDLNAAAERAFQTSVDAIGSPLERVFGGTIAIDDLLADSTAAEVTREGRSFEPTASTLRDEYGRLLGHSFVFHDVTDRNRREQRIQVLNRVLRHNLRNDLNTVDGYAELLEEQTSNPGEYASKIRTIARRLLSVGEKARDIEAVFAEKQSGRTAQLSDVIEQAVEAAATAEDCAVHVEADGADLIVEAPVLTSVVAELVENACRHNDADVPRVEVTTAGSDGHNVSVRVADNGPGIPDHELAPLREGAETPLEHGSGLGLWLVEWGVETLDGRIQFEANEPRGTVATLRLDGGV